MMIGRVFAVVLMVVAPVTALASIITPWEETKGAVCVRQKATAIVERGIDVVDVPAVAMMTAEVLCIQHFQEAIDSIRRIYTADK